MQEKNVVFEFAFKCWSRAQSKSTINFYQQNLGKLSGNKTLDRAQHPKPVQNIQQPSVLLAYN